MILSEQKQPDFMATERRLAQVVPDVPRAAYNRGKFFDERNTMVLQQADYLDQPGTGADAIPLRGERT